MAERNTDIAVLGAECDVFSRHLCGVRPKPYVLAKYIKINRLEHPPWPSTRFDRFSVAFARTNIVAVRAADCYTRFFHRSGELRSKLVLVLALLESTPVAYEFIDTIQPTSKIKFFAGLAFRSLTFVLAFALGCLVLGPASMMMREPDEEGASA